MSGGLRRTCLSKSGLFGTVLLSMLLRGPSANAGGLFLSDRGVRALGRGGAFVAGADDIEAAWYNPAGLVQAQNSVLLDVSFLNYATTFSRQTIVSDAAGASRTATFPTVSGSTKYLPLPSLGASFAIGEAKRLVVAASISAPYAPVSTYPDTVAGKPAASRYSLLSLDGSVLLNPGLSLAYKVTDQVQIGLGFNAIVGTFNSTVMLNAGPPGRLLSAPEDPTYDAMTQVKASPIITPSGNFGIIVSPTNYLRVGLSGQLPFVINAPATVRVRLPVAAPFDSASQSGTKAHVRFTIPAIMRIGIEVRPLHNLAIEAAYVREMWGSHDAISIESNGIQLLNVTGFPSPYSIASISIPRRFVDTNSVRLGGEYDLPIDAVRIRVRGGANYETSAIPPAYLSPLTVDLSKVAVSAGVSVYPTKHWRIDCVYAHTFLFPVDADPANAQIQKINPVGGNSVKTEAINGGRYTAHGDIFGFGAEYRY